MKRLLGRNTELRPTEALGWKHGPRSLAVPRDLVVVVVVRNAMDWALSMHAKPWHTVPELQALDFDAFLRAPWETVIDRPRYFNNIEQAAVGTPLQPDRDPLTGLSYPNLFALRRGKLMMHLSYAARGCSFLLLRVEEVQRAPEVALDRMRAALALPVRNVPFKPVVKRLGSKFQPAIANRPETPEEMDAGQIAFLRETLDLDLEAALGYSYA